MPMPDRMLRDEILKSRRWWSVSSAARDLWLGVFLSADDACRYTGDAFDLRVRCMAGMVDEDTIERLLAELVAVDLLRVYEDEAGRRFLFIPRYRQRMRYVKTSHYPTPPNDISDLVGAKSDSSQTQAGPESTLSPTRASPKTDPRLTQDVRSEVEVKGNRKEVEKKRNEDDYAHATAFVAMAERLGLKPKTESQNPVEKNPDQKPNGNGKTPPDDWWLTSNGITRKGLEIGLKPEYGEKTRAYKDRIFKALQQRKGTP